MSGGILSIPGEIAFAKDFGNSIPLTSKVAKNVRIPREVLTGQRQRQGLEETPSLHPASGFLPHSTCDFLLGLAPRRLRATHPLHSPPEAW